LFLLPFFLFLFVAVQLNLSLSLVIHISVHCFCFQLIIYSCLNTFHSPLFSLLSFVYLQNLGEVFPKLNETSIKEHTSTKF
jgi:hypothetical protein